MQLNIDLENCYGIQKLKKDFDFSTGRTYAIYAPNGLMKTSFTRTFEDIAKGDNPKEERYNRPSKHFVEVDGSAILAKSIYVLKSEIDIREEGTAITNILVHPESKAKYDQLLIELDKLKKKLIASLQKVTKIKTSEIEEVILKDWSENDFPSLISKIKEVSNIDDLSAYEYSTIFDPKAIEILKNNEFIEKAKEFNNRYQELFDQAGSLYTKGVFNPTRADVAFGALDKQGFFSEGHRIQLRGELIPLDQAQLSEKLKLINSSIDDDETLKRIRISLAKNAQTQALMDLIESLSSTQFEFLLNKLSPSNQAQFRKDIWVHCIKNNNDVAAYLEEYASNKVELDSIEASAALVAPAWTHAVDLFNDRFADMPFTLSVINQAQAALGKEKAKLRFTFVSGLDEVVWSREQIKTLSQGEKRALYLLNFIFEVEVRKQANQETLFIIDDIADSFDYKNKHAIVQYLKDISLIECFYQIILTHNFDFYRTVATNFVHRDRCLMANRSATSITLTKAEGVNNYFIGMWRDKVMNNESILCATIPFARNLIEYTKGKKDSDFLRLTCLLHWKKETDQITVGDYLKIYNGIFGFTHDTSNVMPLKDLLFRKANDICALTQHDGLNLENKILLSISIRMQAEIYLINELRILKGDANYWCEKESQFGYLIEKYSLLAPTAPALRTLEKVSITVSSNIHLNSFMYEPILDLTVEHLIKLYEQVKNL
jgi:AAA domain